MKMILIAVLFQATAATSDEPGAMPAPQPVASSFTAEFDSKEACINAARALGKMSDVGRFGVLWGCVPKDLGKLEVEKPKASRPSARPPLHLDGPGTNA